jgi:molybdate transport system permease protein
MTPLLDSLVLSVRIALWATMLTILIGVPLALFMSRQRFAGKSVVEGLIMMPLVLPPTVVGYFILMIFGARGWVGQWLHSAFDYSIAFRFEGAVLAAAVVALPMLYIPAKAAFASVERDFEDIARTLGANRLQIVWHVSIPMARRGLTAGVVLSFARALGEFGATVMVFGMQPEKLTLPISIYADFEHGQLSAATAAVVALCLISLGLIMAYNASSAGKQE